MFDFVCRYPTGGDRSSYRPSLDIIGPVNDCYLNLQVFLLLFSEKRVFIVIPSRFWLVICHYE